ncbi:uncharacterized protein BKA55DRAFT_594251 [Fusarium redolens]|uniref:Uncharacterized protein n=1 Tax=Fusarium redolens TaxID=48865 RepID=A0A9P9H2R0_FUSRE|nr:uncharacterized protein BKA55DRAFT_594251 [Fusarium redolens]KAH7250090.1 hypothetical protein BKA55DRAFT_594251 [Fusarium redolens]
MFHVSSKNQKVETDSLPSPEVSTPQNHTKREWRLMPPSPEKELQNMSPGIMPGSWEDESPIEPIVKTHEYYERDIETRKGTAQHVLMEFDHSGRSRQFPQQFWRGSATVGSLGSLVDLNIDLSTHHTNNIQEENPQLHRLIEDLLQRLSELNENKQIAEEKADRLSEKVKSMKERLSYHMTVVEHCKTLSSKAKELAEENHVLKEQLNDAQSHIFSLQPYRKDLTPEEVGQDYDALVEKIQDWVQKLMNPWLEDCEDGAHAFLNHVKRRITDANRFKSALNKYPDLMNGLNFPETDEDIVTSLIMRYLHARIFQSVLYGAMPRSPQLSPREVYHFTVRTWTAEAYNSLLSCPQFRQVREKRADEMIVELSNILEVFSKGEDPHSCYQDLIDLAVYPAIKLYEKLQVSTNHFYLDISPSIAGVDGELNTTSRFIDLLMRLDCKNVLQNRKRFNLQKLDPPPSEQDLYHNCTIQVGQRDAIKNSTVVRKQKILVAWGSEEQRRAYQDNGCRTLISHLYALESSEEN